MATPVTSPFINSDLCTPAPTDVQQLWARYEEVLIAEQAKNALLKDMMTHCDNISSQGCHDIEAHESLQAALAAVSEWKDNALYLQDILVLSHLLNLLAALMS